MTKRVTFTALMACLTTACGGDGTDFELATDLPRARLIGEFASLAHASSALRESGVSLRKVRLDRPAPNELLFTLASAEGKDSSTFHMKFADGETPNKTIIRVKIDVPNIEMGLNKELSERKVEEHFEKYAKQMVNAIREDRSTSPATNEFTAMFDSLALITNPADKQRLEQAIENDRKGWQSGWHEEAGNEDAAEVATAGGSSGSASKPGWEKPNWGK